VLPGPPSCSRRRDPGPEPPVRSESHRAEPRDPSARVEPPEPHLRRFRVCRRDRRYQNHGEPQAFASVKTVITSRYGRPWVSASTASPDRGSSNWSASMMPVVFRVLMRRPDRSSRTDTLLAKAADGPIPNTTIRRMDVSSRRHRRSAREPQASVESARIFRAAIIRHRLQVQAERAGGSWRRLNSLPQEERLAGHSGTFDDASERGTFCETLSYFTWSLTGFHQHATNLPVVEFAEYTNSQL
jgi:hypothetical protein